MAELERCAYVLPKKKRKCRMLVKSGQRFCGEHAIFDPDETERVCCPNDPKHTVNKSELEDHLLNRCNARISSDPWIVTNLNVAEPPPNESDVVGSGRADAEVIAMREKIVRAWEDSKNCVSECFLVAEEVQRRLTDSPQLNASHRKHLRQCSSIIGNLLKWQLLRNEDDCCVVDFGSGKAQLSYWMAKVAPSCRFLLCDRMGSRNKFDNKALQENESLQMKRLRCSIEHLDLSKVEHLKGVRQVVTVCKHFCGDATDYGIRCVENALRAGLPMCGFAFAPCCHHRCTYSQYVGKSYLERYGINSAKDFALLTYISTWAVCGSQVDGDVCKDRSAGKEATATASSNIMESAGDEQGDSASVLSGSPLLWSHNDKERFGRIAKMILELGRADYLRALGYQVNIFRYVSFDVSPENILLVGVTETAPTL